MPKFKKRRAKINNFVLNLLFGQAQGCRKTKREKQVKPYFWAF